MTRCSLVIILVLATATTSLMTQDLAIPFVVGVWGQGDAIIPFADFDGQSWRGSWPTPVETLHSLTPLPQIPAAWWGRSTFQPTWEVVESDGGRRHVQITGTVSAALGSGCSSNLGLKTDAPANAYQYGSVVATNRAGVAESVETTNSRRTDW